MNDGTQLEKLVRLVQESFKDSPDTLVYSRYKLPNISGRNREIDVYVEKTVNNAKLNIAIECKDYSRAVPVKEIEAFYGKCKRIKDITKKVFVSSNGFQEDSINAAKQFKIALYEFREVTFETVRSWMPEIIQVKPSFQLCPSFGLYIAGDEADLPVIEPDKEIIIHKTEKDEGTPLHEFVLGCIGENERKMLFSTLTYYWIKKKNEEPLNNRFQIPFEIKTHGIYLIDNHESKKYIKKIEATFEGWFEEKEVNFLATKVYSKVSKRPEALSLEVEFGKSGRLNLLKTTTSPLTLFHTKSDGQIYRMDAIAKYDESTANFEFLNKK